MYLRFVVLSEDWQTHRLKGLFQEAFDLRDAGLLAAYEESWLKQILGWFNVHLVAPARFSRSRRPHAYESAICWFKPSATEHIRRMHELATLLEHHDIATKVLKSQRPGYIAYEDRYQVAAVPFRDTVTQTA